MDKGIELRYRWHDNDVVDLRVTAWNGRFGGQANVYVGVGELAEVASTLSGFPNGRTDTREIVLGAFGAGFAGGAARFRFRCRDLAGNSEVEVEIEADHEKGSRPETVILILTIEAAAVNTFVLELPRLEEAFGLAVLCASA